MGEDTLVILVHGFGGLPSAELFSLATRSVLGCIERSFDIKSLMI